ncbi:MAG TPA: hypothetical protein VKA46_35380 [Gemmataceae bacterium]|nr:hypothetical protein [Gemmataceae bacterium]
MATLIINAPKAQAAHGQKKSFESTLNSGIGDGYAITKPLVAQLQPGCRVVLLSKEQKRRAEGTLEKLVATSKAKNGIQRYDVYIKDLAEIAYQGEPLNRNGVSVV